VESEARTWSKIWSRPAAICTSLLGTKIQKGQRISITNVAATENLQLIKGYCVCALVTTMAMKAKHTRE
jgi:hypothetical protein